MKSVLTDGNVKVGQALLHHPRFVANILPLLGLRNPLKPRARTAISTAQHRHRVLAHHGLKPVRQIQHGGFSELHVAHDQCSSAALAGQDPASKICAGCARCAQIAASGNQIDRSTEPEGREGWSCPDGSHRETGGTYLRVHGERLEGTGHGIGSRLGHRVIWQSRMTTWACLWAAPRRGAESLGQFGLHRGRG